MEAKPLSSKTESRPRQKYYTPTFRYMNSQQTFWNDIKTCFIMSHVWLIIFQASKGASTYMDMDEAEVGVGESSEKDENPRDLLNPNSAMAHPIKEETDDNVTEQTHHIIVPSYRFSYCIIVQSGFEFPIFGFQIARVIPMIWIPMFFLLFNHLILHPELYYFFKLLDVGDCLSLVSGSAPAIFWTLCCRPGRGISYRCVFGLFPVTCQSTIFVLQ